MDIVDCHAHIFPPLAGACGFDSVATHRLHQQRSMHVHGNQPVRRARDHAIVSERVLWREDDPSEAGRTDGTNFRPGRFGRFEWEIGEESYYIQFLPPDLVDLAFPVDQLIVQMDYAGISTAVLHNDHIYGNLAADFGDAVRRYPGRFIGLAQVEEAYAWRDDQIAWLVEQVEQHGMRGIYFTMTGFFRNGYSRYFDAPEYDGFWATVDRLKLPVFWVHPVRSPMGDYNDEMRRLRRWYERFPAIVSNLVHGMPTSLYIGDDGKLELTDDLGALFRDFPLYSEVLWPIGVGGRQAYPYPQAQAQFRAIYDRLGPDRLIWGSDMPNVGRYCTYRQSLAWALDNSDFMPEIDQEKIFHSNTLGLFTSAL